MFRNIKTADIKFGNRFNIFYGNNGQGKTNFLEAIFYLGTVKSFQTCQKQGHDGLGSIGGNAAMFSCR